MRNFQDTFETRKRPFISAFSICMTVPLIFHNKFALAKIQAAINRLHHKSSWNIFRRLAVFKRIFREINPWCISVLINLPPCSAQTTILLKT